MMVKRQWDFFLLTGSAYIAVMTFDESQHVRIVHKLNPKKHQTRSDVSKVLILSSKILVPGVGLAALRYGLCGF